MDASKVLVNGAWIEKDFLAANIEEAKALTWKPTSLIHDHQHCLICSIALGLKSKSYENESKRWICDFCFNEFIHD